MKFFSHRLKNKSIFIQSSSTRVTKTIEREREKKVEKRWLNYTLRSSRLCDDLYRDWSELYTTCSFTYWSTISFLFQEYCWIIVVWSKLLCKIMMEEYSWWHIKLVSLNEYAKRKWWSKYWKQRRMNFVRMFDWANLVRDKNRLGKNPCTHMFVCQEQDIIYTYAYRLISTCVRRR